jgi:hypothetical protein
VSHPSRRVVHKTHGDTAIIRQNSLTNAVATVADFIATQPTEKWPDLKTWREMVIETALTYAEFSSGQREMNALAARMKVSTEAEELNAVYSRTEDEAA